MLNELRIIVKIDFELSFWQAIKLRIAGKNIQEIIKENIQNRLKATEEGGYVDHGELQDGSKIIPQGNNSK